MENPINEKNASNLRKYFYEYTVIGLCVAVVALFYLYISLTKDVMKLQETTINKNTEVLNNFVHYQNIKK